MVLLYVDESGSTGNDLDNKTQPYFVLAGVGVLDNKWHEVNDYFEKEKIKIYPEFESLEIHTNELFNSNPKSAFYKNDWKYNFMLLEKIVELISTLNVRITHVVLNKKAYKKHFGNNIIVDPYLYSYTTLYEQFNTSLQDANEYGIVFCDELRKMEKSLEILYPRLKVDNRNVIEKTFYLNSKKNNFIQIADVCSFYINKYNCIQRNYSTMDTFKKEHCLKMYEKIYPLLGTRTGKVAFGEIDPYFE